MEKSTEYFFLEGGEGVAGSDIWHTSKLISLILVYIATKEYLCLQTSTLSQHTYNRSFPS